MDYNQLKTDIVEFIRTNNNEEITGEVLQHILISMVDALGKGYQFAGVATPHTLIPQTDEKVVWLLGSGNYENFGDPFVVAENEFAVMMYDDSFELEKVAVGRPVDSEITEDGINPVEGKVIYEKFAGVEEDIQHLDEAKQDKLEYDQHPTEDSDNPVTSAGVYEADMLLQQAIEAILLLIPSAASELNKLADKNFVNSSIETATATFRGTYNLVTDLELQVGATHQYIAIALSMAITDADNNDYAFVQVPTSDETPTEIAVTQRYKFNGTNWDFEYDLNNSGFTAAQWEAINSGINELMVGKLADLPTLTELTALFEEIRESLESLGGQVSENTSDIAQLRALYEALQQSEPEIIAPTDTWPVEDPSGTVIYRVVDRENTPPEYYSDYMWNGTEMVLMARYNNAVDDRPKKGSTNFVESGGIFDNMGALDISELNATEDPHTPAVYEGLSSALAAVSSEYQAGGMSVKFKNEENEYECYQLTSAEWSTDINDWISINLIKELDAQAGATKYEDIPFSIEKQYIKKQDEKGEIAFSNNQNTTQHIPVSEGDEFLYSGVTPANSLSVAGYEYTNGAYVFKDTLVLSTGSVAVEDKYAIIPAGITHIVACCNITALSSSSFRKIKKSSLEKLKENLGETGSQTIYEASAYTLGQYVNARGSWIINDSAKSLMLEVKAGDIIELYETTGNSNVCTFAKKITDTTFEPLLILDSGVLYEKASYNVTEDMTLCISVGSAIDTPRMTVVRNDMKSDIENLKDTQEDLVDYNKWLEEYDIKLGVMFENIAVIGDSMSRGTLSEVGDQEDTNSFGASYLSCLAKRWNCKSLFHYAKSGTGAWTWLNDAQYGIGRLLADAQTGKIFNAYFIAYGHNDGGDTTHYSGVGEATDTAATVDTSGATPSCEAGNTFCAYYKAIIDNIRTVAPHAMIFLLPEYDNVMMSTGREAYRQAVKDIADLYYENGDKLVHHLDTGGVPIPDMTLGTHYSTIGYAYIAKRINNEVVKVIYNHRDDNEIKYFGSYNTDKTANSPWGVDNSFVTTANLTTLLAGKQDVIEDLSAIRSGAGAGATAVQPATLNSALSNTVAESGVFDLSAYNAVNGVLATYADLSAALTALNALPAAYKTGGMSFKFVHSVDNKYVQYMYLSSDATTADTFTNTANWQEYVPFIEIPSNKNVLKPGTLLGIIQNDGTIGSNNNYLTSDFIPVKPNSWYISSPVGLRAYLEYDVNKNVIQGTYIAFLQLPVRTSSNCRYVRMSYGKTETQMQFEQNYKATEYVAYVGKKAIDSDCLSPSIDIAMTFFSKDYAGGKNLLNRNYEISGILVSDGSISASSNTVTSDYIPVVYGTKITISGTPDGQHFIKFYCFYDINGNVVSYSIISNASNLTLTVPKNAVMFRCSYRTACTNVMIENGDTASTYEEFIPVKKISNDFLPKYKVPENVEYLRNLWFGKKLTVDGDSITHDQGRHDYWQYILSNNLTMNLLISSTFQCGDGTTEYVGTRGIAGSRIAYGEEQNDIKYCIGARYQYLDNNADLIIIAGGTNDWAHNGVALGTVADRTNVTFYGALHLLCSGLVAKFPSKQIVFMTPIKRAALGFENLNGNTLEEFANAIIEVCGYYGIPVIDLFHQLCMNPSIQEQQTLYFTDDTHPNTAGQLRMGNYVTGKVKEIQTTVDWE